MLSVCKIQIITNQYLRSSGGRSLRSSGDEEPLERRSGGKSGDRAFPKCSLESLGNSEGRISTPSE